MRIITKVALHLGMAVGFDVVIGVTRAPDVFAMPAGDLLPPGGLYAAARCSDVLLDVSCGNAYPNTYGARRFVIIVIPKLAVLLARVTSGLVVQLGGSAAARERAIQERREPSERLGRTAEIR